MGIPLEEECFGLTITGVESSEEDVAWKTFNSTLKRWCRWLKGYKYWRSEPSLLSDKQMGDMVYLVRARIVCTKKRMSGEKVSSYKP